MMLPVKIRVDREVLTALRTALLLYSSGSAEAHVSHEEYYRLYILKEIYLNVEKKLMNMVYNNKKTVLLRFDRAQCVAIWDSVGSKHDNVPFSNFIIQLGRSVPTYLTAIML